jgi:hypothetical protein
MPTYPDPFEAVEKLRAQRRAMTIEESLTTVQTQPITRGQLLDLDIILCFMEAAAELFSSDYADDVFNIRNSLVPYVEGEPWFDPELEEGQDAEEE